jgi:hypothetical protein
MAAQQGDSNPGDVWLDSVGQPPGPGGENDPQLPCQNINLWGDNLADPSGTYTIDGWPASGSGAGDQAWPGTEARPGNASWSYNRVTGGSQVLSVIDFAQLIAHALANGDSPTNQGFHFKLQFSQDPQKHKVFWVHCAAGGRVGGRGLGAGEVIGGGRGGGVLAESTPALPAAGVGVAGSPQANGANLLELAFLAAVALTMPATRRLRSRGRFSS